MEIYGCMFGECSHQKTNDENGEACESAENVVKIMNDPKIFFRDEALFSAIFFVPDIVNYETMTRDASEISRTLGLKNKIVDQETYSKLFPDRRYAAILSHCYGILAKIIGAKFTDGVLCSLEDDGTAETNEYIRDRGRWLFADGNDPETSNMALMIASAIFCISIRDSAHRALEFVSYLLTAYYSNNPVDLRALDPGINNSATLMRDSLAAISRRYVLLNAIFNFAKFLEPATDADTDAIKRSSEPATTCMQNFNSQKNTKKLYEEMRTTRACQCGVTWFKFQMLILRDNKNILISAITCTSHVLGSESCGDGRYPCSFKQI